LPYGETSQNVHALLLTGVCSVGAETITIKSQFSFDIQKKEEGHEEDNKKRHYQCPSREGVRFYKRTYQPTGDLAQLDGD
jgi:hypothetical protein